MSKSLIIISVLIILLALIFLYFRPFSSVSKTTLEINHTQYNLEIAKTPSQKAQGLSGRNELCANCGMIFIFNKNSIQPFWMKDTLIPLDMIWLDDSGKVVSIQTAIPEPNTPMTQLKIYQNSAPAKYVIELNGGDAQKLGLKIGDNINLTKL